MEETHEDPLNKYDHVKRDANLTVFCVSEGDH